MKNLTLASGVILSPASTRTALAMDPFFDGEPSVITSGDRSPEHQLRIIADKIVRHGLDKKDALWQEFVGNAPDLKVKVDGQEMFWWQPGWSKVLEIGDIVNPPLPAVSLGSYKPGKLIGISDHMKRIALDIGGGNNLLNKVLRVQKAVDAGTCWIAYFKQEPVNNAVHVGVVPI